MAGALGRLVEHDERSRNFPARTAAQLRSVRHRHFGPVLDQGSLGSCTGNALAQALNAKPLHQAHMYRESDAIQIYSLATQVDDVPGAYPPDDTGSSGLAVCKAAQQLGYISQYDHAFGIDHALAALVAQPVIIGINWYEGFDNPTAEGTVSVSGSVRGGHEVCLVGIDVKRQMVRALNSWGSSWGVRGFFQFSFSDFDRLLHEDGDVTVPRR